MAAAGEVSVAGRRWALVAPWLFQCSLETWGFTKPRTCSSDSPYLSSDWQERRAGKQVRTVYRREMLLLRKVWVWGFFFPSLKQRDPAGWKWHTTQKALVDEKAQNTFGKAHRNGRKRAGMQMYGKAGRRRAHRHKFCTPGQTLTSSLRPFWLEQHPFGGERPSQIPQPACSRWGGAEAGTDLEGKSPGSRENSPDCTEGLGGDPGPRALTGTRPPWLWRQGREVGEEERARLRPGSVCCWKCLPFGGTEGVFPPKKGLKSRVNS